MGSIELGTRPLLRPQPLSSQSHLPSRQGVDKHSSLSPCWVPADGPDDCYYCYCWYLHRREGLQISACLVRGRTETPVSGKLQAFKFLSEKTRIHACSQSWGGGCGMTSGVNALCLAGAVARSLAVIIPTTFKLSVLIVFNAFPSQAQPSP